MTKRRLFIAVNLPENIKKKLIDYQRKWIELDPKYIHWVRESNLHITLVFIGYVTNDEMYEICNLVKEKAKQHEPFFINLEKIILGPPEKTPRMFWVEGAKSQELADLQNDLENALSGGGLAKKEIRPYKPHITLARFKYEIAKSLPKVDELFKVQFAVETIEVMQSNLKRSGAEYVVLESVELGI
ncbi:MAG: RNA 2',3'-cyclic phosphodiesterase [Candidatus Portnoybacteria bacterium CG10_big_fil_rev_8_21_14_0_10_38_18]|uniref:RNA 2',3'-cyclic phosphodiesterase n=1 Tax=Candidatus Portnoybacteria bacterium CG10_big_fil_rev_8_21_14_0_10_38_18 TaxID=1974813 RepID=A0A2M8KCM9_9BACT|nr:MAG: RNA 2',3'-cyclic phosphodiesterase [Candidatus Portnoybacteria bacterium CG10_big_fil_rev_8_21_14_0_10_38_18]